MHSRLLYSIQVESDQGPSPQPKEIEMDEQQTYRIRQNHSHKGYVLISCTHGHSLNSINTSGRFGGSAAAVALVRNTFRCRDCETAGFRKSA